MGMFDSVYFTCPNCNATIEEQSKAGDCLLSSFSSQKVPLEIANSIVSNKVYCDNCGKTFIIKMSKPQITFSLYLEENYD